MSQLLTQWDQPGDCSSPRVSTGRAGGAWLQQEGPRGGSRRRLWARVPGLDI